MQIPSRDIISSVSLFSILGVLIRLGLEELGLQSNDDFVIANLESEQIIDNASGVLVTPIYFDFLSNVFGCFLMGIFVAQQSWMKQSFSSLYAGLTIGLCGSITTFSSWMLQANLNLWELQIINWLFTLAIGFSTALGSLYVGFHLGSLLLQYRTRFQRKPSVSLPEISSATMTDPDQCCGSIVKESCTPEDKVNNLSKQSHSNSDGWKDIYKRKDSEQVSQNQQTYSADFVLRWTISVLLMIFYAAIILAVAILPYEGNYASNTQAFIPWSCLFAPFGALTRLFFSQYNKPLGTDASFLAKFPVFTLLVNVVGSLILGALYIVRYQLGMFTEQTIANSIVVGLGAGFCGCLTTVSTLVNECNQLSTSSQYRYILVSIASSQVLLSILLGIYIAAAGITL